SSAGQAESAAPEALESEEASAFRVREREVGHVDVARRPARRPVRRLRSESVAEEGQLEAEAASRGRREVPGRVPPLGAELGMRPVVLGKTKRPRRESPREARARAAEDRGETEPRPFRFLRRLGLVGLRRKPAGSGESGEGE